MSSSAELACVYAALIMADDEIEVTVDGIKAALTAANVADVPGYLPGLFAKAVGSVDIKTLISNIGSGGGGGGGGGDAGGDAAPAAAAEEAAPPPKEESEEEDMGFGLFD